jgi:hypothetical protein
MSFSTFEAWYALTRRASLEWFEANGISSRDGEHETTPDHPDLEIMRFGSGGAEAQSLLRTGADCVARPDAESEWTQTYSGAGASDGSKRIKCSLTLPCLDSAKPVSRAARREYCT